MTQRLRLAILGSTGSVGTSTLDVVARHPERFEVFGLSAQQRVDLLSSSAAASGRASRCCRPRRAPPSCACALQAEGLPTEVPRRRPRRCANWPRADEVDTVMAAIVGAAGLPPCMAAARAGKRLLLANKEALVVGGGLFMQAVAEGGATLLPIDSEHSAIFQCLPEDRAAWAAAHRPHRAHRQRRPVPPARPGDAARGDARRRPWRTRTGSWGARSRSTRRR